MIVDDEVKLSRILACATKILGAFELPQYTLYMYVKKEWHLGFARLNGTPKGEQWLSADWRRPFQGVHVVMGVTRCLV